MNAPTLGYLAVDRLRANGIRLTDRTAGLIRAIIDLAPQYAGLVDLLEAEGCPQTTARWRMQKKRLPMPSRWFLFGRALHAAHLLQADPDAPTLHVAQQMGYGDHSGLSTLVGRRFGLSCQGVRERTVEELVDLWLDREVFACV